ncbi:hypothetical protein ACVIYL_003054 [Bradyrhizobium sp. USDA 3315]
MQPSSLRLDTKLQVRRAGYDIEQMLFTAAFPRSTNFSKLEIGTSHFGIIYEFHGGPARNRTT